MWKPNIGAPKLAIAGADPDFWVGGVRWHVRRRGQRKGWGPTPTGEESPTTFSCCNIILHRWWWNLIWHWFMNKKLFIRCPKFHQIEHETNMKRPRQRTMCSHKYPGLIACCKLTPIVARLMWRHNYVIGRNEYLISTLSESTVPEIYSLQFLFKSTVWVKKIPPRVFWKFFPNG